MINSTDSIMQFYLRDEVIHFNGNRNRDKPYLYLADAIKLIMESGCI